ncbi:MAG: BTAD domain-containing putative transcriptional regulator [Acidimicrobiales bacterium]|nr:BTAD domain-containing putative transcriptional regulator [Acidimicrobiales bacterium]
MRISRPALADRARRALAGKSLTVVAPAGYGKTTLLEEALAETRQNAAWIRCTEADRHAGRLLDSIARAVNDAVPGSSEVVTNAGDGMRGAPEATDAVRALLAECDRILVDPLAIVIDDAEVLDGAEGACAVLDEMVADSGRRVGVAVLARRALSLRLAKVRGTGRLVELGIVDLAFDAGECNDLVAKSTGRDATVDEVDDLMTATEGWPLGIATLAREVRSGHRVADPDRSLRSPQALRQYLHEEVLVPVADPQRARLLLSAIPRRLTPAIAGALDLPENHLAEAGTGGLFLQRIGVDTFAYHPLFREVLLDQLSAEVSAERIEQAHRSVAPLVAAHDPVETIEHWIAARAWSRAVEAIACEAGSVTSTSPALVRSWLDRLPDVMGDDARVQLLVGQLAWAEGRYETAIDSLRAGLGLDGDDTDRREIDDTATDPRVSASSEWWGRFLLIDCLGMAGRPTAGIAIAEGFDQPAARDAGPIAAAAGLSAAHALASAGQPQTALELASRVNALPGADAVIPIDALLRAYIDIPAGNLDDAAERTLRAYRQVEVDDPLGMRFNLMAAHATVLGEQGCRDEALDWWELQRVEADRALLVARVNTIRGVQALLLAQLGKMSDAEDFLALHVVTDTWADQSAHVARAIVASRSGDRAAALSAAQHGITAAKTAPPLFRWWTGVDLVPALAGVDAFDRADTLLQDAADMVERMYPGQAGRHLRARTTILQAFISAERGDLDRAAALVGDGIDLSVDTAPAILRLEWPRIGPLVSEALTRGVLEPAPMIDCLWSAFPDGNALTQLADHPDGEVRRAAFRPALVSGHPTARAIVAAAAEDADPLVASAAAEAIARVNDAPPPRRFESLGGFRVRRGGWSTDERSWGRPVDARLVRFLLVHGESPVPTDVILEAIWPELDPDGARRSLQVSASRIRQLLDDPDPVASIIEVGQGTYRLRLAPGDVLDWRHFERAADVALSDRTPSLPLLERARSLWRGEPLPEERYSDWAAGWRARLVDLCVEVLVALVGEYERAGDDTSAIRVARELVDLDPYDERSHRLLMEALARAGRRGQALRQYLLCRRMLIDDLGVEPSDATSALHARILAGSVI